MLRFLQFYGFMWTISYFIVIATADHQLGSRYLNMYKMPHHVYLLNFNFRFFIHFPPLLYFLIAFPSVISFYFTESVVYIYNVCLIL